MHFWRVVIWTLINKRLNVLNQQTRPNILIPKHILHSTFHTLHTYKMKCVPSILTIIGTNGILIVYEILMLTSAHERLQAISRSTFNGFELV